MTIRAIPLALAMLPGMAAAGDYPFHGVFALYDSQSWTCAYEFFIAEPDGRYASYALDRQKFLADGSLSYVKIATGQCTVEKVTGQSFFENCSYVSRASDAPVPSVFYDMTDTSNPDLLIISNFSDKAEHDRVMAGAPAMTQPLAFPRCTGTSAAKLAPLVSKAPFTSDFQDKFLMTVTRDAQAVKFENLAPQILQELK